MTSTLQITKPKRLDTKRTELLNKREQLLHRFAQAVRANERSRTSRVYRNIEVTNEFIGTLDEIACEIPEHNESDVPRYAVSSLFLHESFRELTADQNEQFVFITGAQIDGVCVLDQRIDLQHQRRTPLGVTADTKSTHRLLIKLEQFGHRLLAHFHSHPGRGADSTHPSGTDENFQSRLEQAGHVAVGAIFSRDGFVRFFRLDHNFEIEIYGDGVEKHETNVYRLTKLDQS
jgi:hypothetical protein